MKSQVFVAVVLEKHQHIDGQICYVVIHLHIVLKKKRKITLFQ